MRLLAKEKVNQGRQSEIDLLKALCIIGMIFNHVFEDLTTYDSGLVEVLNEYLVVLIGAGMFMFCMGLTMHYSRSQTPGAYASRGFAILTVGQLLNLFRNALPNLIAYWCTGKQWFIAQTLLVLQTDILSFAGLAFLTISLCKRFKVSGAAILGVGIVLNLAAWPLSKLVPVDGNYLVRQLWGFLVLTNAESYFPLTSYFLFVAFGYWIGELYPRIADKDALAKRILITLTPIYAVYQILRATVEIPFLPEFQSDLQYVLQYGPDGWMSCAMALMMLSLLHLIIRRSGGRLSPVFTHLSNHINNYYCISYLFILPTQTLLMAAQEHLWEGWLIPTVYAFVLPFICYWIIERYGRWRKRHPVKHGSRRQMIKIAAIWGMTVLVLIYAYPRIDVYANIWNEYLLP